MAHGPVNTKCVSYIFSISNSLK